jgi:hypothetical protein
MTLENIDTITQTFKVTKEDKLEYGEIYTPFSLIEEMLNMFDEQVFADKDSKWLDPGAGIGYFSIYLFHKLNQGLQEIIICEEERKRHIIKNMLYMVEIQDSNVSILRNTFGEDANIIHGDFLSTNMCKTFDYVIGNPPYNSHGMKKVPTNTKMNKKEDGRTVWIPFIKHSISLLKPDGKLCFIVPSIWLKPDKARTYHYLLSYKIEKIHCLSNTETNKTFKGEAQTPTCFFLLSNRETDGSFDIYDKSRKEYIDYNFNIGDPIPVFGQSVIKKLKHFVDIVGHLGVCKTNLPKKGSKFALTKGKSYPYPNIKTCVVDGIQPKLLINYSNSQQAFYGKKKLVLAHKMYGFPYMDASGTFGISNRDNYVIMNRTDEEFSILKDFLSTKTALYIFEATRYRMKYLEKYAFELMPDVTKLDDFPETITDETIADYFGFDTIDRENIETLHRKEYKFTPI